MKTLKPLFVMLSSSLLLSACNETSLSGDTPTVVDFDLFSAEKHLVIPTFIATDPYDGTLATDGLHADPTHYATDIGDPSAAMGKQDGWATTEDIQIPFVGMALDPDSVSGSVILMQGHPLIPLESKVLVEGDDYELLAHGSVLTIRLKHALSSGTNYLYAVTNQLKDVSGHQVKTSASFRYLLSDDNSIEQLAIAKQFTQDAVKKIINKSNESGSGLTAGDIIYSTWFETHTQGTTMDWIRNTAVGMVSGKYSFDPDDHWIDTDDGILKHWNAAATAITAADLKAMYKLTDIQAIDLTKIEEINDSNPTLMTLAASLYAANKVELYQAKLKLPNFSAGFDQSQSWRSTAVNFYSLMQAFLAETMQGKTAIFDKLVEADVLCTEGQQPLECFNVIFHDMPPEVAISAITQIDTDNLQILSQQLASIDFTDADGVNMVDPFAENILTKYSPIPQIQDVEEVDVFLWVPQAGSTVCSQAPDNKALVSILSHGFGGSALEDGLFYGLEALATGEETGGNILAGQKGQCMAIAAIDHPLHGNRIPENAPEGFDSINAYMRLDSLPMARDNLRQSAADQIALRVALSNTNFTTTDMPDLANRLVLGDPAADTVGFIGVSLGAITGINYSAVIDSASDKDYLRYSRAHFSVPGGGIGHFLFASDRFAPSIKEALLASDGYTGFADTSCATKGLSGQACEGYFFESFGYAAQTILDPIDPIITLPQVKTPYLLTMSENDTVIPNDTLDLPGGVLESNLGGTLPLVLLPKEDGSQMPQLAEGTYNDTYAPFVALFKGVEAGDINGGSFHGDLFAPMLNLTFNVNGDITIDMSTGQPEINELRAGKVQISTSWLTDGEINTTRDFAKDYLYQTTP